MLASSIIITVVAEYGAVQFTASIYRANTGGMGSTPTSSTAVLRVSFSSDWVQRQPHRRLRSSAVRLYGAISLSVCDVATSVTASLPALTIVRNAGYRYPRS